MPCSPAGQLATFSAGLLLPGVQPGRVGMLACTHSLLLLYRYKVCNKTWVQSVDYLEIVGW